MNVYASQKERKKEKLEAQQQLFQPRVQNRAFIGNVTQIHHRARDHGFLVKKLRANDLRASKPDHH